MVGVLQIACAKKPEDRFENAERMADALTRFLDSPEAAAE